MENQGITNPVNTETSAVAAILAEYEIFKKNYENDSLVQAMASQLARLAGASIGAGVPQSSPGEGEATPAPVSVVTAMADYLRVCSSGGMPQEQLTTIEAAVAQAQDLGYFALLRAPAGLDSSDVERLLYVGRVLRAVADEGQDIPLGDMWSEVVCAGGTIKRVLNILEEDAPRLGLSAAAMLPAAGQPARSVVHEGWKEAAVAWEVCASIHRSFAKGRDAVFKTRQSDFVRHAASARARYFALARIPDAT